MSDLSRKSTHMYVHTYKYMHAHVCMYVCMYVCTCMYMYVSTCMYVYVCVHMHVCSCMYIHFTSSFADLYLLENSKTKTEIDRKAFFKEVPAPIKICSALNFVKKSFPENYKLTQSCAIIYQPTVQKVRTKMKAFEDEKNSPQITCQIMSASE
jgi:type IV secretory pathway VirB3-like protein